MQTSVFNDSSLILEPETNRPKRGNTFIYDKTKIGRDFTFRPNTTKTSIEKSMCPYGR